MNLHNILDQIEKIDPEATERLDGRRAAVKNMVNIGGKLALATAPLALGSLFKKAYGQNNLPQILDVLNFALTSEYLGSEFYNTALGTAGLIPAGVERMSFEVIAKNENGHRDFLIETIKALGGTPVPKPTFDFSYGNGSGNGPFKDVFSNYEVFLAVSQVLEDTEVRAYKGQATKLMSNDEVLRGALRIHSVEARHAAHIREIRSRRPAVQLIVPTVKPWITVNQSNVGGPAFPIVQPSYNGEANTVQAGIQIVGINGFAISLTDASEAFDEPLTKEQVLAIVDPFIV